jgi:hypothetical protein
MVRPGREAFQGVTIWQRARGGFEEDVQRERGQSENGREGRREGSYELGQSLQPGLERTTTDVSLVERLGVATERIPVAD